MPNPDLSDLDLLVADLERLLRRARAIEGADLLAYLIDMAAIEARSAAEKVGRRFPPVSPPDGS
jgi:hypothetical protein